jgi:hypothetical protein
LSDISTIEPCRQRFGEILRMPEVGDYGVHRTTGLEGQLLIAASQNA